MTKPNRQAEEAGHTLSTIIATNITNALEHLARELTTCDGWPEHGDSVTVSASSESTTTERAAMARYEMREMRETLRGDLTEVMEAIRRLNWTTQKAMRLRAPKNVTQPNQAKLCRDGITDATRAGAVEWHDPVCMMTGTKLGLCQRHYDARRYWLTAHGIPDTGEHLPEVIRSTREVLVRDGYAGVVHVAYVRTESA